PSMSPGTTLEFFATPALDGIFIVEAVWPGYSPTWFYDLSTGQPTECLRLLHAHSSSVTKILIPHTDFTREHLFPNLRAVGISESGGLLIELHGKRLQITMKEKRVLEMTPAPEKPRVAKPRLPSEQEAGHTIVELRGSTIDIEQGSRRRVITLP